MPDAIKIAMHIGWRRMLYSPHRPDACQGRRARRDMSIAAHRNDGREGYRPSSAPVEVEPLPGQPHEMAMR